MQTQHRNWDVRLSSPLIESQRIPFQTHKIRRWRWLSFLVCLFLCPSFGSGAETSSEEKRGHLGTLSAMEWLGEVTSLSDASTPTLGNIVERTVHLVSDGSITKKGNADDVFVVASGILAAHECIRRGQRVLYHRSQMVLLLDALHGYFEDPGFFLRLEDEILRDPTDDWMQRLIASRDAFPEVVYQDFILHRDLILSVVPVHPSTLIASARVAFRRADWSAAKGYLRSYLSREKDDPMAMLMWLGVDYGLHGEGGGKEREKWGSPDGELAFQAEQMKSRQRLWRELAPIREALTSASTPLSSIMDLFNGLSQEDRASSQVESLWIALLRIHGEEKALYAMATRWLLHGRLQSLWLFVRQDKRWDGLSKREQELLKWLYQKGGELAAVPAGLCGEKTVARFERKETCQILSWWRWKSDASLSSKLREAISSMGWTPLAWEGGVSRLRDAGLDGPALEFGREGLERLEGIERISLGIRFVSQSLSLSVKQGEQEYLSWARGELEQLSSLLTKRKDGPERNRFSLELERLELESQLISHLLEEKPLGLESYLEEVDALLARNEGEGLMDQHHRLGLHLLATQGAWLLQDQELFGKRVERVTESFPRAKQVEYLRGVLALTRGELPVSLARLERVVAGFRDRNLSAGWTASGNWGSRRMVLNGYKLLARITSMLGDEARLVENLAEIESQWDDAYPGKSVVGVEPLLFHGSTDFQLHLNQKDIWRFSPLPREVLMPLPGDPALKRDVVRSLLLRFHGGQDK